MDGQPETFARRAWSRLKNAAFLAVAAGVGVMLGEFIESHSLIEAATTGGLVVLFCVPIYLVLDGLAVAISFYRQWRARPRS